MTAKYLAQVFLTPTEKALVIIAVFGVVQSVYSSIDPWIMFGLLSLAYLPSMAVGRFMKTTNVFLMGENVFANLYPESKENMWNVIISILFVLNQALRVLYATSVTAFPMTIALSLLTVNTMFISSFLKAAFSLAFLLVLSFFINTHLVGQIITIELAFFAFIVPMVLFCLGLHTMNSVSKQALAKLREANNDLKISGNMKSSFLSAIGHEVRTPLGAILGSADLLMQQIESSKGDQSISEQLSMLKTIHISGTLLLDNLNSILEFTKIESKKMDIEESVFDLREAVSSVVAVANVKAVEKDLSINLEYTSDVPLHVKGDVIRVKQVLLNLLFNACKFTHQGGIYLRISMKSDKAEGLKLVFEVQDTGIGMTESTLSMLFKPFSQADSGTTRRYGGSGLGLAIAKGLVELMGGEIWVTSKENVGTSFFFTIPIQQNIDHASYLRRRSLMLRRFSQDVESLHDQKVMAIPSRKQRAAVTRVFEPQTLQPEEIAEDPAFIQALESYKMPTISNPEEKHEVDPHPSYIPPRPKRNSIIKIPRIEVACRQGSTDTTKGLLLESIGNVPKMDSSIAAGMNFLVVDDNAINVRILSKMLENLGATYQAVFSGQDAVGLIESGTTSFDFIFMDIQMPIMDGTEATRRIRSTIKNNEWPQIYALTGNEVSNAQEYYSIGFNGWLQKPMRFEHLRDVVMQLRNKKKAVTKSFSPTSPVITKLRNEMYQ